MFRNLVSILVLLIPDVPFTWSVGENVWSQCPTEVRERGSESGGKAKGKVDTAQECMWCRSAGRYFAVQS